MTEADRETDRQNTVDTGRKIPDQNDRQNRKSVESKQTERKADRRTERQNIGISHAEDF